MVVCQQYSSPRRRPRKGKSSFLPLVAIPVALVGWIDDRRSVPVLIRLGVHFLTAYLFVRFSYGMIPWIDGPRVLLIPTIIFVVWLINAYNFMDGIDGIATAQGIFFMLLLFGSDLEVFRFHVEFATYLCIAGFIAIRFFTFELVTG
jgi:UDP-N-acetylmuramyl pentapeptide phosphotransferase/UDP-N-acetylglucosamine-1-phosphate transferase